MVNPGSVGWPAYADDAPCPHVIEAGSHHARDTIVSDASGRWEAPPRALEYDLDAAVRQGRTDLTQQLCAWRAR